MTLLKIEDFAPNYVKQLGDKDLTHYDVYSDVNDEKIGNVDDILVDEETGHFRYFIVDIGFWIFGKKILMPVHYGKIDHNSRRIYAQGLTGYVNRFVSKVQIRWESDRHT